MEIFYEVWIYHIDSKWESLNKWCFSARAYSREEAKEIINQNKALGYLTPTINGRLLLLRRL
ncbi:MAG: hypothetical protein F6K55_14460 [Moorea sp. SIO4A3]|nr:hypothetical protein [Moorena sp. SIO4A3]NEQ84970.1 hypothetical protein [Moorena sp. SIO2I5]